MNDPANQPRSPYQGLAPYHEEDAPFFFGRERERDLITANLMAARLTVLYGVSGVGKSSVLRAGAAYHLQRLAYQNRAEFGRPCLAVCVFNEWRDDPLIGLTAAVHSGVRQALGGEARDDLGSELLPALERAVEAVDGDIMLILDQFEEYFLYRPHDEGPDSFSAQFVRMVNASSLPVSVLVSIREDSVTLLRRFKGSIPHLLEATLHVDHLTRDAAHEAITGPVDEYNRRYDRAVKVEPELVKAVIADLATDSGGEAGDGGTADEVETPYLQLVMTNLWEEERRQGSDTLRLETLGRLGKGRAILQAHLDARMAALAPREQAIAARVFHHLVTPSGTKIAHGVDDLAEYADVPAERLAPVLGRLATPDARILRASAPIARQEGGTRYEIFHDLLARPILEWRSRFRETTERRRLRRIVAGVVVASLLVAAAIVARAVTSSRAAHEKAEVAEANAAASKSEADRAKADAAIAVSAAFSRGALQSPAGPVNWADFGFPDLAVGATDGGKAVVWSTGTRRVIASLDAGNKPLHTAVFTGNGSRLVTASADGDARIWSVRAPGGPRLLRVLPGEAGLNSAAFDRLGRRVVTASDDGTARIWSVGGKQLAARRLGGPVNSASFDAGGKRVVTASDDGRAVVWSAATGRLVARLRMNARVLRAAFAFAAPLVIAGDASGSARILDLDTRKVVTLRGHRRRVNSVALSSDGALALTASDDGTARIWDSATGRELRVLRGHGGPVNRAVFDRLDKLVATASDDGRGRVWPLDGRKPYVLTGHEGTVNSVTFDPLDSTRVLTAGEDSMARLWSVPAVPVRTTVAPSRSVRGRPIRATYVGSPLSGRKVLVIGCMHGGECAGEAIVRLLERIAPPTGFQLVLVENLNPDGDAAGARGNAHGVDLNRNFPYRWRRTTAGTREYSGPRVLSEPEARAAAHLIRTLKPDLTIWYHQRSQPAPARKPFVDESGGDVAIERRYARLVNLPSYATTRFPGSATTWQNVTFPGTTAFVVELPYGAQIPRGTARRHAQAVLSLARDLPS
jgi:hypothetical protein